MTAELQLPGVHSALLDADTLAELFRDLSLVARVLDVRVKGHPASYSSSAEWTLDAAGAALASGQVGAIQVRYELGAEVWRDTLLRTAEGTRLVRIKEPSGS